MPRNGSGTYSLPAGNPVVSGTTIQASWANSTLADISTELTGSLARSGAGGMLGSLRGVDGTVSVPAFSFTSETTSGFYRAGTGDVRFAMAGADVYTVTSTGVGIGTSSPGVKLEVSSTSAGATVETLRLSNPGAGANTQAQIKFFTTSTNYGTISGGYGASAPQMTFDLPNGTPGNYVWQISSSEKMRLDTSGNLGLGVTPSAWVAGSRALQLGSSGYTALYQGSGGESNLTNNVYLSAAGTWTAITSLGASRYQLDFGAHKWWVAPSGTAGNAITFTQAMTLDASGNLGIGATSPSFVSGGGIAIYKVGDARITLKNNTTGDGSTTGAGLVYSGVDLTVNNQEAGYIRFTTTGNERARITSGGDLLVGTTSLAGAGGVSFQSQSGTGFAVINNNNAGATGYVFQSFRRSSTEIGSVTQNGTTAVLFNTTSDRRLKDNITQAPSASAVIDAIEIVSHDWKAAPDEHVTFGVIAQDLALVAPQAVLQGDDGDEIEKTWGVDYSKLVPLLIKEIQSLRARVAALEAV